MIKSWVKPENINLDVLRVKNTCQMTTVVYKILKEAGNPPRVINKYFDEVEEGTDFNHCVAVSRKYLVGN